MAKAKVKAQRVQVELNEGHYAEARRLAEKIRAQLPAFAAPLNNRRPARERNAPMLVQMWLEGRVCRTTAGSCPMTKR